MLSLKEKNNDALVVQQQIAETEKAYRQALEAGEEFDKLKQLKDNLKLLKSKLDNMQDDKFNNHDRS